MVPSIKMKFLLGFFVIFSVSLVLLNHFIVRIIDTSNEKIITQDLTQLKKNSHVYVRQAFLIHHFDNDEIYFRQIAEDIVIELRHVTSSDVGAYTLSGEMIYASDPSKFSGGEDDDLKLAQDGKTAYTMTYSEAQAEVYYSYPVVIEGNKVGILRFVKDFSLLYEQNKRILDFIYVVSIAIFAAAFLFSYILSRNITLPITRLTRASTEVTNGNLNIRLNFRRKDEIGRLAHNFSTMIGKIKNQIEKIEKDRDRLEELNRHRKQFFDNVTHELKTPLTSISGYAEMIKANGQHDEVFFEKGMNHIVDESKRLHDMVLELLELSKETSEQETFETIDAGQILQDVCEAMAFKARRYNKTITCDAAEALIVWGNANRLRQVFINVIDNAIKYSTAHSDILVMAHLDSDMVSVIIANNGDVVDPSNEWGSRGIGLGISKSIVRNHQGTLEFHNANQKTTVMIQIPYNNGGL